MAHRYEVFISSNGIDWHGVW